MFVFASFLLLFLLLLLTGFVVVGCCCCYSLGSVWEVVYVRACVRVSE